MSFDINSYVTKLEPELKAEFGSSLIYIGLQGSYLRGEAKETSDIDIMVILETLTARDMERYRRVIETIGDFERSCGFICSWRDIANWNPLELCQLVYTTKDIYGTLAELVPEWSLEDERNYVKVSLNNLYHPLSHSFIHGNRDSLAANMPAYYKSAFFILQNTHYLETCSGGEKNGEFILKKSELLTKLQGSDYVILETLLQYERGEAVAFDEAFEHLHSWCSDKLCEI